MGGERPELSKRDDLIEEFRGFVDSVVDRMIRSMNLPRALRTEFVSAGYLGLVEAAERFDTSRCTDFRGYAFLRIRGAVIDCVRSGCEVSGRAYRILRALEAANEAALDGLTGATEEEVSGKTGRTLTHALEFLSKSALAHRLQSTRYGGDGPRTAPENPEDDLYLKREAVRLREIVATLPEKERTIIEQFYFQDKRFIDIADESIGFSKSWVSRLHGRALEMIREKYEAAIAEKF